MVDRVGVFWDLQKCQPSSTLTACKVANRIRTVAARSGLVTTFNAYTDEELECPRGKYLQGTLRASGVTLIHYPHSSIKEVVEMTLAVDIMAFALDSQTSATIVIVTHRDLTYALSALRMRGFRIISIVPKNSISAELAGNVDDAISWEDVVEDSRLRFTPQFEIETEDPNLNLRVVRPEPGVASTEYVEHLRVVGDDYVPFVGSSSKNVQEPEDISVDLSRKGAGAVERSRIGTEDSSGESSLNHTVPKPPPSTSPNAPVPGRNSNSRRPCSTADLAPKFDDRFSLLVETFENSRENGNTNFPKILSSVLKSTLGMQRSRIRQLTGFSSQKKYIKLARSEGIIVSLPTNAWIEIHPRFYRAEDGQTPQMISNASPDVNPPSSSSHDTSLVPNSGTSPSPRPKFYRAKANVSHGTICAPSRKPKESASAGAGGKPLAGTKVFSETYLTSSTNSSGKSKQKSNLPTAPKFDERFSLLVEIFRDLGREVLSISPKLCSSSMRFMLERNELRMQQESGLSDPKEYLSLACTLGIIVSPENSNWVEMDPNFLGVEDGGQTSRTSVNPSACSRQRTSLKSDLANSPLQSPKSNSTKRAGVFHSAEAALSRAQEGSHWHNSTTAWPASLGEKGVVSSMQSLTAGSEWDVAVGFEDAGTVEWPVSGIEYSPGNTSPLRTTVPKPSPTSSSSYPVQEQISTSPAQTLSLDSERNVVERFSFLVETFKNTRIEGNSTFPKLTPSNLTSILRTDRSRIFQEMGFYSPNRYIRLARCEGIITSSEGAGLIEIHPSLYGVEDYNRQTSQRTNPVIAPTSRSTTPSPQVSPPNSDPDNSSPPSVSHLEGFPEKFLALYWLMRELSPSSQRVSIGVLGTSVKKNDPGLYKRSGETRLLPYLVQARSAGVVELSATEGRKYVEWVRWVGLHPTL
ncbi:hypothetical protein SCHPADRAFT_992444 [Schizopora paradoxa]|uniref:NYN domain-containing protein n=1 Tax=Schizopora paradoxa TaxID=27342 RepID=A0A0H2S6F9_9AGAM|nr:hypothetical protein SCHPADRAFT_992444 [Schizopora paradoxa]